MTENEQSLIDDAVEAACGNYRKGIETLQAQLMRPFLAYGCTTTAATRACAAGYPGIFGFGARYAGRSRGETPRRRMREEVERERPTARAVSSSGMAAAVAEEPPAEFHSDPGLYVRRW